MKVIVNFPIENEAISELENRTAEFHSTLVIESIKQLKIGDEDKEKVLKLLLEKLKSSSKTNG
nr:hypothetical protein [Bacilli bacterium]